MKVVTLKLNWREMTGDRKCFFWEYLSPSYRYCQSRKESFYVVHVLELLIIQDDLHQQVEYVQLS